MATKPLKQWPTGSQDDAVQDRTPVYTKFQAPETQADDDVFWDYDDGSLFGRADQKHNNQQQQREMMSAKNDEEVIHTGVFSLVQLMNKNVGTYALRQPASCLGHQALHGFELGVTDLADLARISEIRLSVDDFEKIGDVPMLQLMLLLREQKKLVRSADGMFWVRVFGAAIDRQHPFISLTMTRRPWQVTARLFADESKPIKLQLKIYSSPVRFPVETSERLVTEMQPWHETCKIHGSSQVQLYCNHLVFAHAVWFDQFRPQPLSISTGKTLEHLQLQTLVLSAKWPDSHETLTNGEQPVRHLLTADAKAVVLQITAAADCEALTNRISSCCPSLDNKNLAVIIARYACSLWALRNRCIFVLRFSPDDLAALSSPRVPHRTFNYSRADEAYLHCRWLATGQPGEKNAKHNSDDAFLLHGASFNLNLHRVMGEMSGWAWA